MTCPLDHSRGFNALPCDVAEFEPILRTFANASYKGWLVVEAEQNPAKANPLAYVTMARKYLREVTGL